MPQRRHVALVVASGLAPLVATLASAPAPRVGFSAVDPQRRDQPRHQRTRCRPREPGHVRDVGGPELGERAGLVLLEEHRDTAAAERFSRRLPSATRETALAQNTTGKLGSYAAVLARLPTLAGAERLQVRPALQPVQVRAVIRSRT
jgi:hypothetical protein